MRHVCQNFANASNFVGARTTKAKKNNYKIRKLRDKGEKSSSDVVAVRQRQNRGVWRKAVALRVRTVICNWRIAKFMKIDFPKWKAEKTT